MMHHVHKTDLYFLLKDCFLWKRLFSARFPLDSYV